MRGREGSWYAEIGRVGCGIAASSATRRWKGAVTWRKTAFAAGQKGHRMARCMCKKGEWSQVDETSA